MALLKHFNKFIYEDSRNNPRKIPKLKAVLVYYTVYLIQEIEIPSVLKEEYRLWKNSAVFTRIE